MDPRMEDRDPDERYLPVFLVNETSELTGETIVDATHRRASMDDPSAAGGWQVNLEF
ncbi:MAG: hypothetical protein GWN59_02630, partial [Calditrichae bacterium]|nr:hypothetical protein [Calditrichia bacterium]